MELPSLIHDYRDALIERVEIGPRHEVTLTIATLIWEGTTGRRGADVRVRFGGIQNFAQVCKFLDDAPHEGSELACLRYALDRSSKPGQMFIELAFERIDARILVECLSVQIDVSREVGR
ncbi:MAG: hypothetical protein K8T25_19975 [Planctomycetia bacterium]|nr:hypothetical protein [Planctomycetia bacterium]